MKTYYFPDSEYADTFFGGYSPICVDYTEVERLAREWEYESTAALLDQMHEAEEDEINEYGVFDSDEH